MNKIIQQLYFKSPYLIRSAAASVWGFYLNSFRYGPETERMVQEALDRESWTAQDWKLWQQKRISNILRIAAGSTPAYQAYWLEKKGSSDWECLKNWPILEKEKIRKTPDLFLSRKNSQRLFSEYTSGTTGTPIHLRMSREVLNQWYALFEARWRRWYGVSRADRWGILGGQLVAPVTAQKPPFWVWNQAMRQLYLSSYHLSNENIPSYLEAIRKHKVVYLYAYPSAINVLAQEALRLNFQDIRLKVVITNAEPLLDYQKQAIAKAFGCRVVETYGMSEMVAGASECEHGRLHLWPEAGYVEAVGRDLICTGLLNTDMPLIRYRVGDCGIVREDIQCPCGRQMPVLESLDGRSDDVLKTMDGRWVGRLDPVFKSEFSIKEAQIIQKTMSQINIRYVPGKDFNQASLKAIESNLKHRLGSVNVSFEKMAAIPRGTNGKFRAVISLVRQSEENKGKVNSL